MRRFPLSIIVWVALLPGTFTLQNFNAKNLLFRASLSPMELSFLICIATHVGKKSSLDYETPSTILHPAMISNNILPKL